MSQITQINKFLTEDTEFTEIFSWQQNKMPQSHRS